MQVQSMTLFCCVVIAGASGASEQDDVLKGALQSHAAATGSIRTMHCRATVSYEPSNPLGDCSIEYWRSGEVARSIVRSPGTGTVTEALVKDGVVQSAVRASGADSLKDAGGTIAIAPNTPIPGDCWSECLFMAYGSKNFRVSIPSLFTDNHKIRSVSRKDEGGSNSSVVVDMSHERMRLEITFSVHHNYLARRIVLWSLDGARHPDSTLTVTDFLEVEPGVYIPRKVVTEVPDRASGKVKTKKIFEIIDAKVNQPIPAEAMGFRFPTGATVLDLTTRKAYKADASGQATQPALSASGEPIEVVSGTLSPAPVVQSGAAQSVTEAADEPKRWAVLLRYMALIALVLGLGVWGYNRLRRNR